MHSKQFENYTRHLQQYDHLYRLVLHKNFCPSLIKELEPVDSYQEFKALHGIKKYTPTDEELAALEAMQKAQGAIRQYDVKARVALEMTANPDAFYLFDTLTFQDAAIHDSRNSLNEYQRRAHRYYCRNLGYSLRTENLRKVAKMMPHIIIPEYGSKTQRLHWHVFWRLPAMFVQDPNEYLRTATHAEIDEFKRWWPYGWSTPEHVRYPGDAYTRLGWRIPPKSRDYTVASTGAYIAKYVAKDVDSAPSIDGHWRRTSKGFGRELTDNIARVLASKIGDDLQLASLRQCLVECHLKINRIRIQPKQIIPTLTRTLARETPEEQLTLLRRRVVPISSVNLLLERTLSRVSELEKANIQPDSLLLKRKHDHTLLNFGRKQIRSDVVECVYDVTRQMGISPQIEFATPRSTGEIPEHDGDNRSFNRLVPSRTFSQAA